MTDFSIPGFDLDAFVAATLAEDLGQGLPGGGSDVTSQSVIPADARFSGVMDSRDAITVCGLPIAAAFFRALDPAMRIAILVDEGAQVSPGSDLMRLEGNARAMLTAERSALNTVQHLSGIATLTRQYVDAMGDTRARLLDTRKTIPGLRHLEKYAVRTGGGTNHRLGLYDAVLIKENHIAAVGGVAAALQQAQRLVAQGAATVRFVQIEVETLAQLDEALTAGARMVLLDNMDLPTLREAVRRNTAHPSGPALLEVSGGVNLETVRALAETGVDRISIGALTKDLKAVDFSLRFEAQPQV